MSVQTAPHTSARTRWAGVLIVATIPILFFSTITRPLTHWELDEMLFRMGVEDFEPLDHRPHPPGYPLLVGLGKLLSPVTSDGFDALVLLAILAVAVSFMAFAAGVARMTGNRWTGLAASTLFHLSPAMMIHGPMPMSDPPALMFASLALWASSANVPVRRRLAEGGSLGVGGSVDEAGLVRRSLGEGGSLGERGLVRRSLGEGGRAALTGAFAAASIGCRPQYALAILPFLVWVLVRDRRLDRATALVGAFTAVCLAWITPLIVETGGLREMIDWQRAQAGYVAQNDAALARRGYSMPALVFRFVAHPWGSKITAAPVLALAGVGVAAALAGRMWALVPVAVLSGTHLLTTIAAYDPADGVRYALPGHFAGAAFAAVGLTTAAQRNGWRLLAPAGVAAFVAASWLYVKPVIDVRRAEPSPPAQAAAWASRHLPANTLILYDRSLAPHAHVLFRDFETRSSDSPGDVASRAGRPTMVFGEGANQHSDPVVFSWPDSDAYRKMTRNHYRVVSLTRLESPIEPLTGVFTWESAGGPRWRWLSDEARFDVGPGSPSGTMVLALPADAPSEQTTVSVYAGDRLLETASLQRGATLTLRLTLPAERFTLAVFSSAPYTIPGDRRRFGVQLLDFDRTATGVP